MAGLLLGGAWAWLLWAWLGAHAVLHADALWLYDLMQGQGLSGWDLPPASSLFPDLPLLWGASFFAEGPVNVQRVYGLLMGLWLWRVLARLIKELLGYASGAAHSLAASALIAVLLLTPAGGLGEWLLPGHHGTAFVAALSLWAWALRQQQEPSGRFKTWMGALLAGLLLGSDSLYALWAGPPLLLLAFRLRSEARLRLLLAVLAAVAVAYASRGLLRSAGLRLAVPRFGWMLQQGWQVWLANLGALGPLLKQALALSAAAAVALGLWAWPREGRHSGPRVLLSGWVLAALGTLGLAALLGTLTGRYLYPLLLLPALLLPALLVERWPRLDKAALLLPLLGGLLWLGEARSQAAPLAEPQRQALWLDEALGVRGLRYGWADYWHARPLRLLSQRSLLPVPMSTEGGGPVSPYFWIGDRDLFLQGAALTRPQFVVLNGLDEGAVIAELGKPSETLEGEGLKVWVYRDKKEPR